MAINLNLKKEVPKFVSQDGSKETYTQDFPNGFITFYLSKTPTSKGFNSCYIEFGCDIINEYNRKYRTFDAKSFATLEAFNRGKAWASEVINIYRSALAIEKSLIRRT